MGYPPFCLPPDFRPGSGVVGIGIVRIVELVQQLAFTALGHRQRQIASPFHSLLFGDQDQLRPVGAHGRTSLLAHIIWHQQLHLIAFKRGDHRQRNAGIAAGCFNQYIAGLNFAALFRFDNHRKRGAIFYRTGRVIPFQFDPDFAAVIWSQTL